MGRYAREPENPTKSCKVGGVGGSSDVTPASGQG